MPQFVPSETKTARAAITVLPSGLSCQAELYLVSDGAKAATSGLKPFTSTGAAQDIAFPVTMPGAGGSYTVYLDIYASGILIGAYQAIENVTIASPNRFDELYCTNFYHTTISGWPVDRVTFVWKVTSVLPVTVMRGEFYVTGPLGEAALLIVGFYAKNQDSFSYECTLGADQIGITASGKYPYRVRMTASHWDGVRNIEVCVGEKTGTIQYTI